MVYSPPTLDELRARVARDLQDPTLQAFTTSDIDDYINGGISEINGLRPLETKVTITDLAQLDDVGLDYIFKVDSLATSGLGENLIPPNNDESNFQNGWTYFAGSLVLPQDFVRLLTAGFEQAAMLLVVYGYRSRDQLVLPDQVADFNQDQDEQAVRQYARWRGLGALRDDRALYQQWQTAANNADVSPTQLTNMAQVSDSEWARTRRRIYEIRRPAVGW